MLAILQSSLPDTWKASITILMASKERNVYNTIGSIWLVILLNGINVVIFRSFVDLRGVMGYQVFRIYAILNIFLDKLPKNIHSLLILTFDL
jgi:hypothetical protein